MVPLRQIINVRSPHFCNSRLLIVCMGLCGRSATSIVASYACSFRLRRFASPLEKQSRPWRPINSNRRFEYDRLVCGRNLRHRRKSAHLPLPPSQSPLQQHSSIDGSQGALRSPPAPLRTPFGCSLVYYESKTKPEHSSRRVVKRWAPKGSRGRSESPLEITAKTRSSSPQKLDARSGLRGRGSSTRLSPP